jgi:hypothetical protein
MIIAHIRRRAYLDGIATGIIIAALTIAAGYIVGGAS